MGCLLLKLRLSLQERLIRSSLAILIFKKFKEYALFTQCNIEEQILTLLSPKKIKIISLDRLWLRIKNYAYLREVKYYLDLMHQRYF